ncbi:MAG: secretin N-terminal domain-containing protein [Holosporaceae bacterium]|nr:secretin N-terminal domain-containing protein [Holosporaceae bacterium]
MSNFLCYFSWAAVALLAGCVTLKDARTPQQENLNPEALNAITSPADDFMSDAEIEELTEEETDEDPKPGENFYRRISISATENMKMREILTKMADLAGINVFIVQDVEGSISFSAKDRPFLDILNDICSSAGLKYSVNGNSVKIEIDTPMLKIYDMQFLNIRRDTQTTVSVSTDIFMNQSVGTKPDAKASGPSNNGSGSCISGAAKSDFWSELETSLKSIMGNVENSYLSVHKQGGLITVYAPQSKHNEIKKYLRLLKDNAESQVLIEAKILEVRLSDEYKSGINWNILRDGGAKLDRKFLHDGMISFGVDRTGLNAVAGLIEKFGSVKTLSSPRITVMNNQTAVLKVTNNEVIYIPELQRQYATVADNRSTDFLSTTIRTIPEGLMMSVLPSVDRKSNTILLSLRPTVSKIISYKEVPFLYQTVTFTGRQTDNKSMELQSCKIPVIAVRELDSVLRLNSGQIVVMGGLMREVSQNNRDGLPGLSETDLFFGSSEKTTEVTELVIFLRATILRKGRRVHHNADKKIYDKFAQDPRPLRFEQ